MTRSMQIAMEIPESSKQKKRAMFFGTCMEKNLSIDEIAEMVSPMRTMSEEEKESYAEKLMKELDART